MKNKISIFFIVLMILFNTFDFDLNSKTVDINTPAYAIEPATASLISYICGSLALSLGFKLIESQSENFTKGVMQLHSNFSTNVKNLIDRIGRKKMEGSPTFDITPDELQAFGDELTSAIEASFNVDNGVTVFNFPSHSWDTNNGYELKRYRFDELNFNQYYLNNGYDYGAKVPMRLYYDNQVIWDRYYIRTKIDNPNFLYRYQINNTLDDKHFSSGYSSLSSNVPYVNAWNDYGKSYFEIYMYDWSSGRFYFDQGYTLEKFRIELGEADENMPVIGVGDMPIDDLILALKNSGVLNGQGAITQNFISNLDTALPSDAYNDLNNKTIVDGLFTGFDTALPDVPSDFGILQNILKALRDFYQYVKTGIRTMSNTLSQMYTSVKAIPDTIATTLTALFVPPAGFMDPIIFGFETKISDKIGKPKIDLTQFAISRVPEDFIVNLMGQSVTVFKAEPLIFIADKVRAWIIGFLGIMALIFNYNNFFRLISSSNYTNNDKGGN